MNIKKIKTIYTKNINKKFKYISFHKLFYKDVLKPCFLFLINLNI